MHKVYVLIVEVVQKGRDSEKKKEIVFSLCIKICFWDEFEQAGEFQDTHGGVEGGGSWA